MFKIAFIALVLLLTACVAPAGNRPTSFNYPPSYLENFQLGISEQDAVMKLGAPDATYDVSGKHFMKYFASKGGTRSYSLLIENGVVTDVVYNESGSLNGQTAKALQAAKPSEKK